MNAHTPNQTPATAVPAFGPFGDEIEPGWYRVADGGGTTMAILRETELDEINHVPGMTLTWWPTLAETYASVPTHDALDMDLVTPEVLDAWRRMIDTLRALTSAGGRDASLVDTLTPVMADTERALVALEGLFPWLASQRTVLDRRA